MVRGVLARAAATLLALVPLALAGGLSCATLEDVAPGCGNRVVEDAEDCDGPGKYLCGAQDTPHQCRFVWDEDHDCPLGYIASADKRCRKGSGALAYNFVSFETPGSDPAVADLGGDGVLELGMIEDGGSLALYSVVGAAAVPIATLPTFSAVAMGEVSGDASTDIVIGTDAVSAVACGASGTDDPRAGLSVLRSFGDSFSLKVYANGAYGTAVRFIAVASWLFADCELLDLDVLTRLALVDAGVEICAVDDCKDTTALLPGLTEEKVIGVDSNDANAVVSVQGQGPLLHIPREGYVDLGNSLANQALLFMAGDAVVEAGVALAEVTGDEWDDVVVIGRDSLDGSSFGLYVLPGAEPLVGETYPGFAGDTLEPSFPIDDFHLGEGGSTVFESGDFNGDGLADFFLGDRIWVSTGVPVPIPPTEPLATYYRSECWVDSEDGMGGCDGSRAAAIGDINGDGLDDIVGSGGTTFGAIAQVLYGGDRLPLVRVDLPIEGLGAGGIARIGVVDFDGDGADDMLGSFVPKPEGDLAPAEDVEDCTAGESLLIAYGKVGALPDPPSVIAQVPTVRHVATGRFRSPPDGFGDFAVAVSCGSSATLLGDPYRRVSSPFLFDDSVTASFRPRQIAVRDVVASTQDEGIPHPDLIVAGDMESTGAVLLVPSWGDAELSLDPIEQLEAPASWRDASENDLTQAAIGIEAQEGVVALAGIVFPSDMADANRVFELTGDWAIATVTPDGPVAADSVPFPDALTAEAADGEQEQEPFVRIAVSDLNGDQAPDFVAVYGMAFTPLDVTFDPNVDVGLIGDRVVSAVVLALSDGDGYVATTVTGFDASFDAPVDVVVLDGKLRVVTQYSLYAVDAESSTASFTAGLGADAPASEAAVGDFSGDGLTDVMVFDGARGYLLEQLPLKP